LDKAGLWDAEQRGSVLRTIEGGQVDEVAT